MISMSNKRKENMKMITSKKLREINKLKLTKMKTLTSKRRQKKRILFWQKTLLIEIFVKIKNTN